MSMERFVDQSNNKVRVIPMPKSQLMCDLMYMQGSSQNFPHIFPSLRVREIHITAHANITVDPNHSSEFHDLRSNTSARTCEYSCTFEIPCRSNNGSRYRWTGECTASSYTQEHTRPPPDVLHFTKRNNRYS